jgi:alpha-L-fucosidase
MNDPSRLRRIVAAILLFGLGCLAANAQISPTYLQKKFGFFVHYVWAGGGLTVDRHGKSPASFDALADAFDAKGFAADMEAWGVEYVIFTAWHANINPLFPSETMQKWGMPGHACKRDVLRDVIDACKSKGIPVMICKGRIV